MKPPESSSQGLHPPFHRELRHLELPPLSDPSDETLRRLRVFLYGVALGGFWVKAVLAGYTPNAHLNGSYLAGWLSGERPFGEWRQWRSLRPPQDPDLPAVIAQMEAFLGRWQPRSLLAIDSIPEGDLREEVATYLGGAGREYPSVTWRAKAFACRLEGLAKVEPYRPAWLALVALGVEEELARFRVALAAAQEFILSAPLDQAELDDIQRTREEYAAHAEDWLDEQRSLLQALGVEDLTMLGLGEVVPPPGFEAPIRLLARIDIPARA